VESKRPNFKGALSECQTGTNGTDSLNPNELLAKMPPKVLRAFQIYEKVHSIRETARQMGVSHTTISRWKKEYKWDEIERAQLMALMRANEEYIERIKEEQREIIGQVIDDVTQQIAEGKIKVRNISDLITLLRYQLKLEGEFKETNEVNVNMGLSLVELHEELKRRRKNWGGYSGGE